MESSENLSPASPSNSQEKLSKPEWLEEKSVNELKFCNELLSEHELRFIEDCFYDIDGAMPIQIVENIVAEKLIGASVSYGIANKIKNITNALKHLCYSEEVPQVDDEINVRNGVLKTDGAFLIERKFCHNRLNVTFAVDTSPPLRWISFMNELLEPDDVKTLQEYMGYCLINSTKAQTMLFLVGKGGEGKSRIGVVMNYLFGNACYCESIVDLSKDKYLRGNLVGKTVLVDDDMSFEGIKDTSFIKSLVTSETSISVQWKNRQAIQAQLRVRAMVFSNSPPTSLYDKTDGWHRRLIVLSTKPAPVNRVIDRDLSEKLISEIDGIFLWAFEGLRRLISNNYQFTLSDRTSSLMKEIRRESCNISEFIEDSQAVQFIPNNITCSVDIYNAYCNWCYGNGLTPFKQKSFYDWLSQNADKYNLIATNKAHNGRNYVRGYSGIRVSFKSILS